MLSCPSRFRDSGPICIGIYAAVACATLFGQAALYGGEDLVPHLWLIDNVWNGASNVYAPAYRWVGALAVPVLGFTLYVKLFALGSGVLSLIGLGRLASVVGSRKWSLWAYVLFPYSYCLVVCVPKVELAALGPMYWGLALAVERKPLRACTLLVLTFYIHTATAIAFGGALVVVSVRRWTGRQCAVAMLAVASGICPLLAAHLCAGCSVRESLLFARGGYEYGGGAILNDLVLSLALASPPLLVLAAISFGRRLPGSSDLSLVLGYFFALYLGGLAVSLAGFEGPFSPVRGLTLLLGPVSILAGSELASFSARRRLFTAIALVWLVVAATYFIPGSCWTRPVDPSERQGVRVERCRFIWSSHVVR